MNCLTHLEALISGSCLITSAKGSVAKTKSPGDKGHPCRLELPKGNIDGICPLICPFDFCLLFVIVFLPS